MNYIDKIIYINLDYRTDRKKEIEDEFKKFNIPEDKIIRMSAIIHPDPGVGCNLSHAKALTLANELNLENVLILEDDCNFKELFHSNLEYFFCNIQDYDTLLLCMCNGKSEKIDDVLSYCLESSNGCAYLVNKNMFLTLANEFEQASILLDQTKCHWIYQNDQIWKKFMTCKKWFCFNQHIAYQRKSFSDLSKTIVFRENLV